MPDLKAIPASRPQVTIPELLKEAFPNNQIINDHLRLYAKAILEAKRKVIENLPVGETVFIPYDGSYERRPAEGDKGGSRVIFRPFEPDA